LAAIGSASVTAASSDAWRGRQSSLYGIHPDATSWTFDQGTHPIEVHVMFRRMSRRFSWPLEVPRVPTVTAVAFIVLGLAGLIPFVVGASREEAPPDGEAAMQRRETIRRELSALGAHPWAGEYYEGDGLGANIEVTLAPMSGVAATWNGCLGLYGANRGRVVERAGMLVFGFETPNGKGFGSFPDAVVPVRWGQRRYLLPESEMAEFVSALHHGIEPRGRVHGRFLLARGDEQKPVSGLPELPVRYRRMIRSQPVLAGVLDARRMIGERFGDRMCLARYRVTLDRGHEAGLTEGLRLKAMFPRNVMEEAQVLKTTATRAIAEIEHWETDCKAVDPQPDRSWKFSTGAYVATRPATP
jgi:hypothetical protein